MNAIPLETSDLAMDDGAIYLSKIRWDIRVPDSEIPVLAGELRATLLHLGAARMDDFPLEQVFDLEPGLQVYAEALAGAQGCTRGLEDRVPLHQLEHLLVVERLEVRKAFRGRDLGLKAIASVMDAIPCLRHALLEVGPLQFSGHDPRHSPADWPNELDEEVASAKLEAHYGKLGFKRIGISYYGSPLLLYVHDRPFDE